MGQTSPMLFADALTLDAPRRTQDGYMAVRAKAARTGTYAYLGSEIDPQNAHGLRDAGLVHVLRDDAAVFDSKSAHSFIGKPITDNHPKEAVNAANWRDHARGVVMGAMRDGEYLAFDLLLTDGDTITAVDAGKRELSNGYAADLQFGDFTGPGGVKCVAKQVSITGNHVAIVDKGRAGASCAITDSVALCDANPAAIAAFTPPHGDKTMKTLTIDGLKVPNVSDEAEAAIVKLQADSAKLTTDLSASQAKVAELTTGLATKDAEIATLKQQVADAAITPAKLRDAAKGYAIVCDKAKALGVQIAQDADEAAIRRAVVDAKLGDAAKGWTDDQVSISFDTLTVDAKPTDPLRTALTDGLRQPVNDAAVVSTLRAARYS